MEGPSRRAGLNSGVGGRETSPDDEEGKELASSSQGPLSTSMGVSTGT